MPGGILMSRTSSFWVAACALGATALVVADAPPSSPPPRRRPSSRFLLKDIVLLAASVAIGAEALRAAVGESEASTGA